MYAITKLGQGFKGKKPPPYEVRRGRDFPEMTKVIYTHKGTYSQAEPIEAEFLGQINWQGLLKNVSGAAAQIISATRRPPAPTTIIYQVPKAPPEIAPATAFTRFFPRASALGPQATWILPAAIGAGGLVLIAMFMRRQKT